MAALVTFYTLHTMVHGPKSITITLTRALRLETLDITCTMQEHCWMIMHACTQTAYLYQSRD